MGVHAALGRGWQLGGEERSSRARFARNQIGTFSVTVSSRQREKRRLYSQMWAYPDTRQPLRFSFHRFNDFENSRNVFVPLHD